ncbi:N-6 DNA methylase [Clostridium gasigenes]|uniref:DNA methyltransferase n=1 Tax=Clostridium gasigenes TaxID=94869 RepID=UPI001C0E44C1|nr:DNA methyltransferase [Clostridium gasigenes]MBU3131972.1 N-6 DNA methylase [Clostridium gasigenes]
MKLIDIEKNINKLASVIENDFETVREVLIYELLSCYGVPKASITKLKNGNNNISKNIGEILWKKKLFFKECKDEDIYEVFLTVSNDEVILKNEPRFIIVTKYDELIALDTTVKDTLNININEIHRYYTFFLPWAGMKKSSQEFENQADIKAAEKMAKIYDEVKKDNGFTSNNQVHQLNIFWARVLFCFFAEDTGLFESKLFTNSIESYTQTDGSDLNVFLEKVFEALNTQDKDGYPEYLKKFPYVGGTLFKDKHIKLNFTIKSRKSLIGSGKLEWSDVNPDIFGSMIQAVVNPDQRSNLGMHYTSVTNILKVVKPLFLDDIENEFKKNKNDATKLKVLLNRLSKIKIFDPACGSGNFLLIAYRELRELEMKIIRRINDIDFQIYANATNISLDQFYGIELDDFAHEIAKLSLWLMEQKMESKFNKQFGMSKAVFPIVEEAKIINANALQVEWKDICIINNECEVYLLGNPPYLGARLQSGEQKKDVNTVFDNFKKSNNLDYIACWIYKAAVYIKGNNSKSAFVSTNSICQGEQVEILWPKVFELNVCISFAYTSFKWENNAKSNAAVICAIIGLQNNDSNLNKRIFTNGVIQEVKNINPYLMPGKNIVITKSKKSISGLPPISFGSMPNDGNNLILSTEERNQIISNNPLAEKYIERLIGAKEITQNKQRWCIWLKDIDDENIINEIHELKIRVEKVKDYRLKSTREATRKLAEYPQLFGEIRQPKGNYIAIPRHSSEKREYIPMNLYTPEYIINDSCMAIETNEIWILGILMSSMHMMWVKTVGGKIKTDYRYSADICYNTFPFPEISQNKKNIITEYVLKVIEEREKKSEKSLAELYNTETMTIGLKEAHNNLDLIIERCYRSKEFKSEDDRLECLFNLYEQMM